MASSAQFTVTGTSVQIVAAYGEHRDVYMHNMESHAMFVGGPNVTVDNGLLVEKGEVLNIRVVPNSSLWAVSAADKTGKMSVLYETP